MKKRYNIMLDPTTVKRIDFYAADNDMTRSELIEKVMFEYMNDVGVALPIRAELINQMRCDSYDEESYYNSSVYIHFD